MDKLESLNRRDAAWILAWTIATLLECLRLSWGRQLWSDEIFGWMLIHDPSMRHMSAAWRLGADGGGIFFYLTARIWTSIFGDAALPFRFLSAFCMAVALGLTWITARRWYRLEVVAFALPFCWFTAQTILQQMMLGRFYGMLMLTVAAAIYCTCAVVEQKSQRSRDCLLLFASHCLLVGTHPFGLLYSAAILCAMIVIDASRSRWRPFLYASALAGWLILLPSRTALEASAAVGKPHFWTTTPTVWDLRDGLAFWTPEIMGLELFLILCLVIRSIRNRRKQQHLVHNDTTAIIIGSALALIIPLLWLVSLRGTSYFVDRYLTGTIVGVSLLLCATIDRLVPSGLPVRSTWCFRIVALALFGGTTYSALFYLPVTFVLPPHSYTQTMANMLPRDIPIVVERGDVFAEAVFSQPDLKLRYLLDWDIVNLPESPRGEVSGYHEMDNWKRSGYFSDSIVPSQQFLDTESEFLVITDPTEQWFVHRVEKNSAFAAKRIGQFIRENDTETVWHVYRLH